MNSLHISAATLPGLCQLALQTGLGLLIQSTLLLLIGIAAGRFLRRRGPERQLHVYHATLAAVALCGLFSVIRSTRCPTFYLLELPAAQSEDAHVPGRLVQTQNISLVQSGRDAAPDPRPAAELRDARGRRVEVRLVPMPDPVVKRSTQSLKPFTDFLKPGYAPGMRLIGRVYVALLGLWGGVAFALLLWLAVCHAGVRRICRRARPVQEGEVLAMLTRVCAEQGVNVPVLLVNRDIHSVFLAGWARPAILLPGGYAGEFDPATLQAVLAHEAAHLRTGDGRWTCFTRILCSILWMQPLLWYVCRLREQASEEVCDQAAVAQGVPAPAYARCLIALRSGFSLRDGSRWPAAAAWSSGPRSGSGSGG